ncbi:FCD domain-containing protein [Rhodoplanes serenus]|uniref:FCD domain-containing protein n=2 Tax=Rhodoplanes serenus TaxID=200615 RepID=A0A327K652_9BRAD|nr:GntR family transcriptional regulator [Rhodoplanes serenus]MTW15945.1 FCD domain-containing protein [Rhodoplanes serenus]RAI34160.1 hypothetical protein CH340_09975 [Rhodoplanes serenus]
MGDMKQNVHADLLGALRDVVTGGDLPPASRVPEKQLCDRFGVSRTPLREALKALAAEGLVDLVPNRGAWTKPVTIDETRDLFSVIGALEELAGEQCCTRITEAETERLRALHVAMRARFETRDLAAYYALNRQIHEAIVASTRNEVLTRLYMQTNARIARIRFVAPMPPAIWTTAMQEHDGMMNAIERRDGTVLGNILRTHLRHKCAAIIADLESGTTEADATEAGRRRRRPPA